jgi:hypothetical protein
VYDNLAGLGNNEAGGSCEPPASFGRIAFRHSSFVFGHNQQRIPIGLSLRRIYACGGQGRISFSCHFFAQLRKKVTRN